MKFECTWVGNFQNAVIGMRNPLNSWERSDSIQTPDGYNIGQADLDLMQRLLSTGNASDSKFMRQIAVSVQITCPAYFAAELDTYKVGTTRNSCSLQHKGASRDFMLEDFTFDEINEDVLTEGYDVVKEFIVGAINGYRELYKLTKDYKYFRIMRQLMPMGYNYTFMWSANYEVLRNIYFQRRHHQLKEWSEDFVGWIKSLPYAKELIMFEPQTKKE